MEKMSTTAMVAAVALGAAATMAALGSMKPNTTQQFKRDMKNTLSSMEGVKNEMGHVGEDMTEMARNLKKNMM